MSEPIVEYRGLTKITQEERPMVNTRQATRETRQATEDAMRKTAEETHRVAATAADPSANAARAGADMMRRNVETVQRAFEATSRAATELTARSLQQFSRAAGAWLEFAALYRLCAGGYVSGMGRARN
jgi:hypothetical protein